MRLWLTSRAIFVGGPAQMQPNKPHLLHCFLVFTSPSFPLPSSPARPLLPGASAAIVVADEGAGLAAGVGAGGRFHVCDTPQMPELHLACCQDCRPNCRKFPQRALHSGRTRNNWYFQCMRIGHSNHFQLAFGSLLCSSLDYKLRQAFSFFLFSLI